MANQMTQEQREMQALRDKLAAVEAQLEAAKKEQSSKAVQRLTVKCAKYGAGTISLYGIQRFPLSFRKSQWAMLQEQGLKLVNEFAAENPNVIRASGYAHEYACKVMNITKRPETGTPQDERFMAEWQRGYDAALLDTSLVPSR
ncbi:MAG: hypothetical protein KGL39_41105 [Patescibacteria group bacterium]|nr:hypothetical protein [Patescibacteria group bacterium]